MSQQLKLTLVLAGSVRGLREDKYLLKAEDTQDPLKFDILEAIPAKDGPEVINQFLKAASEERNIPVAQNAFLPVRKPALAL